MVVVGRVAHHPSSRMILGGFLPRIVTREDGFNLNRLSIQIPMHREAAKFTRDYGLGKSRPNRALSTINPEEPYFLLIRIYQVAKKSTDEFVPTRSINLAGNILNEG